MNPIIASILILFLSPKFQVVTSEMILHAPPFKQCHTSTLTELGDGSLLVAFFGGSAEGAKDVKIWGAREINGHWSDPFVLADGKVNDGIVYACWNPVLFRSKAGILYLFYKIGKNPREWFGMMKTSSNDGRTWSDAINLPSGYLGPIKNKPLELSDDRLLCGSSVETLTRWSTHMEIWDMSRGVWSKIPIDTASGFQAIQPTILAHSATRYQILCRTKQNVVASAISEDSGLSWTKLDSTQLPNPNSGIDGIKLDNGIFLLVFNPLTSGKEWFNGRNQLHLGSSSDGINWKDILVLENHPDGEYSYPAIIQTSDKKIHITYTFNRINIKHVIVSVSKQID